MSFETRFAWQNKHDAGLQAQCNCPECDGDCCTRWCEECQPAGPGTDCLYCAGCDRVVADDEHNFSCPFGVELGVCQICDNPYYTDYIETVRLCVTLIYPADTQCLHRRLRTVGTLCVAKVRICDLKNIMGKYIVTHKVTLSSCRHIELRH